jgi:hypothetical protein
MKKTFFLASVFLCVVGITTAGVIAAQYDKPQADKPKPAEKTHTMTGCLEKGAEADMFRLSNVEGTGPKTVELHADANQKLSAHLGHKIAITGTTVDPATMKKGTTGKPAAPPEPKPKPTGTEHHMRVTAVKMIAATCPS